MAEMGAPFTGPKDSRARRGAARAPGRLQARQGSAPHGLRLSWHLPLSPAAKCHLLTLRTNRGDSFSLSLTPFPSPLLTFLSRSICPSDPLLSWPVSGTPLCLYQKYIREIDHLLSGPSHLLTPRPTHIQPLNSYSLFSLTSFLSLLQEGLFRLQGLLLKNEIKYLLMRT